MGGFVIPGSDPGLPPGEPPRPPTSELFWAIKNRKGNPNDLYVWDSMKAGKRVVTAGQVAFAFQTIYESDSNISHAIYDPEPVMVQLGEEWVRTELDAYLHMKDGEVIWEEYKRSIDATPHRKGRAKNQLSAQAQAASERGIHYRVKTEKDLVGLEFAFSNSLMLCGWRNRVKSFPMGETHDQVVDMLSSGGEVRLEDILKLQIDRARVLGVIALLIQSGLTSVDYKLALITNKTLISLRTFR